LLKPLLKIKKVQKSDETDHHHHGHGHKDKKGHDGRSGSDTDHLEEDPHKEEDDSNNSVKNFINLYCKLRKLLLETYFDGVDIKNLFLKDLDVFNYRFAAVEQLRNLNGYLDGKGLIKEKKAP